MDSIAERYGALLREMVSKMNRHAEVSDKDVFQPGLSDLLPYIDTILEDHFLPGSGIDGLEHLVELKQRAARGESCLLLMEHYSNFDLPAFHLLLRRSSGEGLDLADSLVAIAGIKLSESHPVVNAFAQAYTRIIIYPSRSLAILKENIKVPSKLYHEMKRSLEINRAALRALEEVKHSGRIVLVFPAGTRFRPWDPGSKKGVREIASYVKSFDNFSLVAINGNILRINPSGEMEEDLLHQDKVVFTASPVRQGKAYIEKIHETHHFKEDKKQELVDHLMAELESMHEEAEKKRHPA